MSPFDQNIDYDAGHAIDPSIDQDDLIAFHLHELSPPQERALHRVLRTSPTLQSESVAIAATLHAFPKHEAALPLDAAALDRHWLALRPSLSVHIPPTVATHSLFPRSLSSHWALSAFAGSALVATVLLVSLHHNPHTTPTTVATTQTPVSTAPSIPPATPPNAAPVSNAPTSGPTLIASTQRPWSNNHLNSPTSNQTNNPSSFPPSAPKQTALANPTPNLPPSEPLAPTSPTQVSPATTTNTTTATTESPASQSTNTTSATSPSPTQLSKLRPPAIHHPHTTDITLAILADLTPDRSSTTNAGAATYTQATTSAIGALASFHQQLRPFLGYRITATHSEPTFEYTYQVPTPYSSGPQTTSAGNTVYEHVYELSGTYVVQGPRRRRITTSAEVGTGLLAFLPPSTNIGNPPLNNAFRPEAVFGVSAELALTKHWALHAGYRALLYKSPASYYGTSYGVAVPPNSGMITLSSNPIVGITYRFGAIGRD